MKNSEIRNPKNDVELMLRRRYIAHHCRVQNMTNTIVKTIEDYNLKLKAETVYGYLKQMTGKRYWGSPDIEEKVDIVTEKFEEIRMLINPEDIRNINRLEKILKYCELMKEECNY